LTGSLGKRELLLTLTALELRTRYGGGRLRILKWLVDPLGFIAIYLVLMAFVLDRPGEARGLTIACAVIPFQLVTRTLGNALSAVRRRRALMSTLRYPRGLVPAISTLTETAGFVVGLALLAVLMGAYRVAPNLAVAWLPLAIGATLLVALALAYLGALLGFWFPGIAPFAGLSMRALFFLASGLVALEETTGAVGHLLKVNPLTGLFEAYRDTLIQGQSPAAWELLYPLGVGLLLLAICVPVYRREQREFAKA
jgi:ABC-type polysaccharide/polyol phosphate export permease